MVRFPVAARPTFVRSFSLFIIYIGLHLKLLKVYACFFVGEYSIRKTNSFCVYGAISRNVCDLACHTVDNAIVADNK